MVYISYAHVILNYPVKLHFQTQIMSYNYYEFQHSEH